jgi:hypothetical protein
MSQTSGGGGKVRAKLGIDGFGLASKLISISDAELNERDREEEEIPEGQSGVFLAVLYRVLK